MARSIWKGTISFGLVTIGVELFNAEAPERLDLDMIDQRDMSRIGYLKINKRTGKPVNADQIVKGYAVGGNKYVVLSDADLKAANPKATRTIDVLGFVAPDAIPLLYYSKPYLTAPTKGSDRAYVLFRNTLESMGRIAVAQVVLRTRQYLAAVYPYEHTIVTQLLRYHEEVRTPSDLDLDVAKGAMRPAEQAMARKLIEGMAMDWDPTAYRDTYRDDVLKLIKQRAKGARSVQEAGEPERDDKVIDLMEALRRSVNQEGGRGKRRAPVKHRRTARSA